MNKALWFDPFYLENFGFILVFLILLGLPLYIYRNKKVQVQASWASVKSWMWALPFLFFFIGLPKPGPLIFLHMVGIYSVKRFMQMVGLYHKSFSVYSIYLSLALTTYALYKGFDAVLILTPVGLLFFLSFIPVLLDDSKKAVQILSLSFVGFFLFGWGLIIATKMLMLQEGVYLLLYLYALSEFATNTTNGLSLLMPNATPVVGKISAKAKWPGFLISFVLTLTLAWGFRRLLFDTSEPYWISAGLICFFGAHYGEWTLSTFRKDIGLKDHGVFIIGRGDLLSRTSRIMFSYPFYVFLLWWLGDLTFSF